mmetsp:Transcript_31588/g.87119  ORF Transcript_31588/g.87119 Transcript_31588/m.87119 type:complete len:281 (-) Transcript_31588:1513-2355(-)
MEDLWKWRRHEGGMLRHRCVLAITSIQASTVHERGDRPIVAEMLLWEAVVVPVHRRGLSAARHRRATGTSIAPLAIRLEARIVAGRVQPCAADGAGDGPRLGDTTPPALIQGGLELRDMVTRHTLLLQVLHELRSAFLVACAQRLRYGPQAIHRQLSRRGAVAHRGVATTAAAESAQEAVAHYGRCRLELPMPQAAGDHGAEHARVQKLRPPAPCELAQQRDTSLQCHAAVQRAAAEEHRVDDAARRAAVLAGHIIDHAEGLRHQARIKVQPHEDGKGDV